jgi:hypothetical protein
MVPRNQRQEALSRAYVRAVAAQAGLVCAEPEQDFGVDLCLRRVRLRGQRHSDASGQLDLQIKSTTRASVTDAEVLYDLEVKNYDDLREAGDNCPRFLVVLVLPEDEGRWLSQSSEELILRHCAYWLSLAGFPATTATRTVRIAIPRANVFSVEAVQRLMDALRQRGTP